MDSISRSLVQAFPDNCDDHDQAFSVVTARSPSVHEDGPEYSAERFPIRDPDLMGITDAETGRQNQCLKSPSYRPPPVNVGETKKTSPPTFAGRRGMGRGDKNPDTRYMETRHNSEPRR